MTSARTTGDTQETGARPRRAAAPSRSRRDRDFVAARGGDGDPDGVRAAILAAAARAFGESGYAAASIDDVARRMGATKGIVYHYYRSKNDLFFDVCQHGMALDFAAVTPHAQSRDRAVTRLRAMAEAHIMTMMHEVHFQLVILQGVSRHLNNPTTPEDKASLDTLIAERDRYEALFRGVIAEARTQGDLPAKSDISLAGKTFLAVINSPVFWYRERDGETADDRRTIARDLAFFALRGAGADDSILEEEFDR
ncbi:TetR/AcrR family transcriptional regulator [Aurantimonas coralicida]|uniref:TetR/AcrR family transcriptional regulator n=1 Tax=Aurantimonas coralicida TaxID=182270 RepID=UPI0023A5DBFE|nr:TetR/AcrR family transcriptional regulator [Aurantimonas coralicida]MDE0922039.1 TetR/AcrR family transcriptional regulator [Aurantimonas coralicida]